MTNGQVFILNYIYLYKIIKNAPIDFSTRAFLYNFIPIFIFPCVYPSEDRAWIFLPDQISF